MVSREKSGRHQPRAPKQKFKKSMGDRLFDGFNVLFMLFILFVTLYPFWEQLVMSFSSGYAVYEGGIKLWPLIMMPSGLATGIQFSGQLSEQPSA